MDEPSLADGPPSGSRGVLNAHPIVPDSFVEELHAANRLAAVMLEQGYQCTSTESLFTGLVKQFSNIDASAVAEVLGMMARTCTGLEALSNGNSHVAIDGLGHMSDGRHTWNRSIVLKVFNQLFPQLQWPKVIAALDHPGFVVPHQQAFLTLMSSFQEATAEPFPISAIVGSLWTNVAGQLSFLKFATVSLPEVFSFDSSISKQPPLEGLHGGKAATGTPNQAWLSLDLLQTLCDISDAGHSLGVKAVLEYPLKHCPELLLLGMAAISTELSPLQASVLSTLIPMYLGNHPNSSLVLSHLWRLNKNAVIKSMVDWYSQDATRISRILDICQELKELSLVLDATPHPFALELAALAARREYLNLEKWLFERFQKESLPFINATLKFLDLKTQMSADGTPVTPGKINLSTETLALFLRVLQQSSDVMPPEQAADLKTIQGQAMKLYPALAATLSQASTTEMFANDIEEEADRHFHEIYQDEKPLEDVVAMLKSFKTSANPREQEVFACMIHNLFDEYRFFPRYPDRELQITAKLFGALIHHQLVSSITLGIALRYVLEALRKSPSAGTSNAKMFRFGVDALNDFKADLHQWPQYCTHIMQIPHMAELEPQMVVYIQRVTQDQVHGTYPSIPAAAGATPGLGDVTAQPSGPSLLQVPATQAGLGPVSPLGGGARPLLSNTRNTTDGHQQPSSALNMLRGSGARPGAEPENGSTSHAPASSVPPPPPPSLPFPNLPTSLQLMPPNGATSASLPGTSGTDTQAEQSDAANSCPAVPLPHPGPTAGGPSLIPTRPMPSGPAPPPPGANLPYATQDGYRSIELNRSETLTNVPAQVAAASLAAPSLASTLSAETLEAAAEKQAKEHKQPPESVSDKVHFIINNLSLANMDQKVQDLITRIFPDYGGWFANYMVVKRASQELNFHSLYIVLMDKLGDKDLMKLMVRTTHTYIKVLLNSDRIKTHTSERSLLKNLGSWLGLLTFAKSKPVLSKDLDMKGIMCEAYERGKMIGVIPFVHRVLEPCKTSKIFRPPNPYISGILSLLVEIYMQENLKLNLKFEIESIFRGFDLELLSLKPSDLLKSCKRDISPMSPDFTFVESRIEPHADKAAAPPVSLAGPQLPLQPGTAASPALPPLHVDTNPQQQQDGGQAPSTDAAQPSISTTPGAPPSSGLPTPPSLVEAPPVSSVIASLHKFVTINPTLGMLAERLQLKKVVPMAVDRAICEIITPVVERSVTIACMTTYELVMKDFSVEPDEQKMRKAAHLMVSSLAGSLALVTCKDPLRVSLSNQLRAMLTSMVGDAAMMEQAVQVVVNDNLELGCTVIERAATDKATQDIDKSLQPAYEQRQKARAHSQAFYDIAVFQQQQSGHRFPAALPDALKPRPAQLQATQHRVYEDFSRLPRGAVPQANAAAAGAQPARPLGMDLPGGPGTGSGAIEAALLEKYTLWQQMADTAAGKEATGAAPEVLSPALQSVVNELVDMVTQSQNQEDVALFLGKRVFKHLYESVNKVQVLLYVSALGRLNTPANKKLPLELTNMFMFMEDDRKYQKDIGEALFRARLFSLTELDAYLSKVISTSSRPPAVEFVINTVKKCMVQDSVVPGTELTSTLEMLARLAMRTSGGAVLLQLIDQARNAGKGPRMNLDIPVLRERSDPPGLKEQVAPLFEEWIRLTITVTDDKVHTDFVNRLHTEGYLKTGELMDRFLRILADLAINHCISSDTTPPAVRQADAAMSFMAVDALVRLITCLVTQHNQMEVLNRFLTLIVLLAKREADDRHLAFNSRPYLRIMAGLICELCPTDALEAQVLVYLTAIGRALYSLQPVSIPAFAFAWLQLLSHRSFMPRLLLAPNQQGWSLFEMLLVALLKFMEPHLRNAEIHDSVRHLYKGTLRLLLVLLHDFPEFLCEHHFQLCDVIPPSCIQMRNLILSAFPRNMRLPDPFTPNLKVDLLPEISQSPRVLPDVSRLLPDAIKQQVDASLLSSTAASVAPELVKRLVLSPHDARLCGTSYNVPLINALVLYIGIQAKPDTSPAGPSPASEREIFLRMARELDHEGRYLFLNAIANQLRYPNSHTHYYSCVLLYLFNDANMEVIQEQITRVLLERLIVNRPHPWGLLITFIELIKNPRYNFWTHQFTRCAPEIERLFESVARSCMGSAKQDEDLPAPQLEAVRA